ncbi:MAG: hypothetical protein WBJ37_12315 [Bacteroidales bacterium]
MMFKPPFRGLGVILWLRAQFVRIEVNYPDTGEPTKQSDVSRIGSTQKPGYLGEAKDSNIK